jgi:glutamate/tyrosine decarboxylase-like PLP-dependent enzyme
VTDDEAELLRDVASYAERFQASLGERRVHPETPVGDLRLAIGGPLPEAGASPTAVVRQLIGALEPGVVASAGPRYFGFVVGGALPAALAADWITALWDQNAFAAPLSPAAAAAEEVAGAWAAELLGIPAAASFGLVTGTQTAHLVALAAARDELLRRSGRDPDEGLAGAAPPPVVVGEGRHASIDRALRFLGLGQGELRVVPADGQGRMIADALADTLAALARPAIVCVQAGNVNTGAFDPIADGVRIARDHGCWVHVDGAFGLWAAASPRLAHLVSGHAGADSWAVDAHKWLNVPYDSGLVYVARPEAHHAATRIHSASYYVLADEEGRDGGDWVLESSRRARGLALWAALRTLGRTGVAELVERCCALAGRFAEGLCALDDVRVLNDVVLNQVLFRVRDDDATTDTVVRRVQEGGICWLGGTSWQGGRAIRISVSSWRTTAADVDRSVDAIRRAIRSV